MDDLIRREDAIYVASGFCHPANAADEIRKLPAVRPWIPVTERMPEEDGLYLVTVDASGERYRILQIYDAGRWVFSDEDIIAWMPLPEPYEAAGNSDSLEVDDG